MEYPTNSFQLSQPDTEEQWSQAEQLIAELKEWDAQQCQSLGFDRDDVLSTFYPDNLADIRRHSDCQEIRERVTFESSDEIEHERCHDEADRVIDEEGRENACDQHDGGEEHERVTSTRHHPTADEPEEAGEPQVRHNDHHPEQEYDGVIVDGAVGLIYRHVGVRVRAGVGVGYGDAAETLAAEDPGLFAFFPMGSVEAEGRVRVAVRPAIDGDANDVGGRIEACAGKHGGELIADVAFEFVEWSLEEFDAARDRQRARS